MENYRFLSSLSSDQRKEIYTQCELNCLEYEKKGTRYKVINIYKKRINVDESDHVDEVGDTVCLKNLESKIKIFNFYHLKYFFLY